MGGGTPGFRKLASGWEEECRWPTEIDWEEEYRFLFLKIMLHCEIHNRHILHGSNAFSEDVAFDRNSLRKYL